MAITIDLTHSRKHYTSLKSYFLVELKFADYSEGARFLRLRSVSETNYIQIYDTDLPHSLGNKYQYS